MYEKTSLPDSILSAFGDLGINIFHYKELDSTNKAARLYASEKTALTPALFVADTQSEGRGRLGRSFFSPKDTGLYMTLLLPRKEQLAFTRITSLCAIALHNAIKKIFGVSTRIKWVNDLYLNGKKVSGILAESFTECEKSFIALGIGVNISTESFPSELADVACSLTDTHDSSIEEQMALKFALAYEICKELNVCLGSRDIKKYMDDYRMLSCVIGQDISFFENGKEYTGKAIDINDDGALIVSTDRGNRTLSSGEISVRVK